MILSLLCCFALAVENPFRSEVSPVTVEQDTEAKLTFLLVVPQDFHLYRDMMHIEILESGGIRFQEAQYPIGLFKEDPANPTQFREQYDQTISVSLPFQHATVGQYEATFEVGYQGCRGGLCYRPAKDLHTVSIEVVPPKDTQKQEVPPPKDQEPQRRSPEQPTEEVDKDESNTTWLAVLGVLAVAVMAALLVRKTSSQ
ncbi:MAG: protein-disulfide reductase DsbD domain-containing protein [Myxococcota bacterium]|nr:protein-disulfide reductase DsbD domain-containing protein [Myxococcota bacterium]